MNVPGTYSSRMNHFFVMCFLKHMARKKRVLGIKGSPKKYLDKEQYRVKNRKRRQKQGGKKLEQLEDPVQIRSDCTKLLKATCRNTTGHRDKVRIHSYRAKDSKIRKCRQRLAPVGGFKACHTTRDKKTTLINKSFRRRPTL